MDGKRVGKKERRKEEKRKRRKHRMSPLSVFTFRRFHRRASAASTSLDREKPTLDPLTSMLGTQPISAGSSSSAVEPPPPALGSAPSTASTTAAVAPPPVPPRPQAVDDHGVPVYPLSTRALLGSSCRKAVECNSHILRAAAHCKPRNALRQSPLSRSSRMTF